ncbi:XrtA/PEP-CTERM system exopolysaccharide export protein [Bacterioplanoides sp.]|uniref:XrtA/PEP-CTERM system exopolysaccharide export protein n=1 Tax=Bacterioplanoides sp. TaxID=2066072 RepID=UPI003AFFEF8D
MATSQYDRIKMKFASPLLLLLTTIISGCSTNSILTAPPPPIQISDQYLIGHGDILDIRVWRNPELSVTVPVRPDGKISVPLAGEIAAAGESTESLKGVISKKLFDYIQEPTVTIIVAEANSTEFTQRVRITGAVAQPLSTPWRKGMTVLDLVLLAGGSTVFAAEDKAFLYRKSDNSVRAYPIDLEGILKRGELDTNFLLSPADIITVPERLF